MENSRLLLKTRLTLQSYFHLKRVIRRKIEKGQVKMKVVRRKKGKVNPKARERKKKSRLS
jgi:hypothetical protein